MRAVQQTKAGLRRVKRWENRLNRQGAETLRNKDSGHSAGYKNAGLNIPIVIDSTKYNYPIHLARTIREEVCYPSCMYTHLSFLSNQRLNVSFASIASYVMVPEPILWGDFEILLQDCFPTSCCGNLGGFFVLLMLRMHRTWSVLQTKEASLNTSLTVSKLRSLREV